MRVADSPHILLDFTSVLCMEKVQIRSVRKYTQYIFMLFFSLVTTFFLLKTLNLLDQINFWSRTIKISTTEKKNNLMKFWKPLSVMPKAESPLNRH